MAINFELYKVFMAAATNRSFSKAAEELFVTQSAVSQSISKLESELDKKLFERSNSGLSLTDDGKFLLENISSGYNILMQAENKVKTATKKESSSIKIACSPLIYKHFVLPFLSDCIKKNICVSANSLISDKDKVFFVKEGLVDFSLIKDYGIPVDLDLMSKKLFTLNYVFFYNPKFFDIKNVDDIINYPLIIKASDTKGRKEFEKVYSNISINSQYKIEVSHDDLVITAAEAGLGIGYAPREYISKEMKVLEPPVIIKKDILLIYKEKSQVILDFIKKYSK